VITSGKTLCIKGTGTYAGSLVVRSGGQVVVCGNATIFGSVTINSGGTYCKNGDDGPYRINRDEWRNDRQRVRL